MSTLVVHREGETAGVPWQVVTNPILSGYRFRWRQPTDHLGGFRWEESAGAFYDGEPDHPEGGIEWAAVAVQRFLTPRADR